MRRWADYDGYFGVHTKLHTAKGKAMSIGIYLRVSSNKGQDTRSQEPDLQTWGKAQPEEIVWYRDRFTGTTMDRPGLERLLADARGGKVTKLCVWRLDRLGRTANGLLNLLEELQVLGIGFVSLREGFDIATPAGRLMAGVLASVAAYETEVRKERQLAGIAKAKADGKTWGGRRPGTRVKLTEEKEAIIHQLHAQGVTVASIARTVGLTRKTVYRALNRAPAKGASEEPSQ
jgi:DNA invertase Pin-like site-specific DNA recombinase